MLAKKTEEAISILYAAGGCPPSSLGSSAMPVSTETDQQTLTSCLTAAGFLDRWGRLRLPLNRISLYDVLAALDEGIYPALREDQSYSGFPNKQQLYHSMIKQLLSRVTILELWQTYEFTHMPLSSNIKSEII